MRVAAHESRLRTPPPGAKDGVPQRVYLEGLVKRRAYIGEVRYAAAMADLRGPERPEALDYLWERFATLDGMRHEGTHGPAPFTPESIAAANVLFCWQLEPYEVEALRMLDVASRHPETMDDPKDDA